MSLCAIAKHSNSPVITCAVSSLLLGLSTAPPYIKLFIKLAMWANAQRDSRPAEYMWRPLFNAAKFG